MKNKVLYITFLLFSLIFSQELIAPQLHSMDLINYLKDNYKTSNVLGYSNARDILYAEIDNNNGSVYGIYTNYSVVLDPNEDPSVHLYENGMNCEHLWPQSLGAGQDPAKSDMHHLRPCKENVNSSRGNKPFNDIIDSQTNTWFWLNYQSGSIPQNNIDEYSESGSNSFEPREDVKGDIARSMFYFHVMYSDIADQPFFEGQKNILKDWHYQDIADESEFDRTMSISNYQDNLPNPFIIDSTLVRRCYFYIEEPSNGDVNLDGNINVIDVVLLVDFILGYQTFSESQLNQSDINNDSTINIIDVVILVENILN